MPISTATIVPASTLPSKASARRCLFERPADAEPNDQFVKRLLDEIHEAYKAKWEFDFIADAPLHITGVNAAGDPRFVYEQVAADTVPGFYRMSSYAPVLPSSPVTKSDNENYYGKNNSDICGSGKYFNNSNNDNNSTIEQDLDVDSENLDPRQKMVASRYSTSRPWSSRYSNSAIRRRQAIFNGSCDDIEISFEEEEETESEQLLNDSTSSSGSSGSESCVQTTVTGTTTVAIASTIKTLKVSDNSADSSLNQTTTLLEAADGCAADEDDEDEDAAEEQEELLASTKRRASAVTPKKQSKLTDFMTRHRKSLQRSAKKSDGKSPKIMTTPQRRPCSIPKRKCTVFNYGCEEAPSNADYSVPSHANGDAEFSVKRRKTTVDGDWRRNENEM